MSVIETDDYLSGPELVTRAGITYRKLDYWVRAGAVVPQNLVNPGSGCKRIFTELDVVICRVIDQLSVAGSVSPWRRSAKELYEAARTRPWQEWRFVVCDLEGYTTVLSDLDVIAHVLEVSGPASVVIRL